MAVGVCCCWRLCGVVACFWWRLVAFGVALRCAVWLLERRLGVASGWLRCCCLWRLGLGAGCVAVAFFLFFVFVWRVSWVPHRLPPRPRARGRASCGFGPPVSRQRVRAKTEFPQRVHADGWLAVPTVAEQVRDQHVKGRRQVPRLTFNPNRAASQCQAPTKACASCIEFRPVRSSSREPQQTRTTGVCAASVV